MKLCHRVVQLGLQSHLFTHRILFTVSAIGQNTITLIHPSHFVHCFSDWSEYNHTYSPIAFCYCFSDWSEYNHTYSPIAFCYCFSDWSEYNHTYSPIAFRSRLVRIQSHLCTHRISFTIGQNTIPQVGTVTFRSWTCNEFILHTKASVYLLRLFAWNRVIPTSLLCSDLNRYCVQKLNPLWNNMKLLKFAIWQNLENILVEESSNKPSLPLLDIIHRWNSLDAIYYLF